MGEMNAKVMAIKLDGTMGLVVLILNILCCGLGTVLAGVLAKGDAMVPGIVIGLVQWFFCWLFCPWIWAIYVGWTIYKNSSN